MSPSKEVEKTLRSLVNKLPTQMTEEQVQRKTSSGWSTSEILREDLRLRNCKILPAGGSEGTRRKRIRRGLLELAEEGSVEVVRKGVRGRGGRFRYFDRYWLHFHRPLLETVGRQIAAGWTNFDPHQFPGPMTPAGEKGKRVHVSLITEHVGEPMNPPGTAAERVARAREAVRGFLKDPVESATLLGVTICEVLSRLPVDSFLVAYPERREMKWPCREPYPDEYTEKRLTKSRVTGAPPKSPETVQGSRGRRKRSRAHRKHASKDPRGTPGAAPRTRAPAVSKGGARNGKTRRAPPTP